MVSTPTPDFDRRTRAHRIGSDAEALPERRLPGTGPGRFWHDAHAHTVHDAVRWKCRTIGDDWPNGRNPSSRSAI